MSGRWGADQAWYVVDVRRKRVPKAARVVAPPPGFPRSLVRELTLRDGRHVYARPVLPSDEAPLRKAVEEADPETLRMRFLGGRPPQEDGDFQRLVCLDYDRRLAVAAFSPEGKGVGIARYEAIDDTDTAEVAVAVDPLWRQVGLATALMRLLADGAIRHRIRHFTAEFFASNLDVADMLGDAPVRYRSTQDDAGVVSADIVLPREPAP